MGKEESTESRDYLQTAYKPRKRDFSRIKSLTSASRTRCQPMSAASLWYFSSCVWINDRDLSTDVILMGTSQRALRQSKTDKVSLDDTLFENHHDALLTGVSLFRAHKD